MRGTKKLLILIVAILLALGQIACSNGKNNNSSSDKQNNQIGAVGITSFTERENCAVFYLTNFKGNAIFELERTLESSGSIYYSAQIDNGELQVVYDEKSSNSGDLLFTINDSQKISSSGGSVTSSNVSINFQAAGTPISGKVVISFMPFEIVCENGHFWGGGVISDAIGGSYEKQKVYSCRICDQSISFGLDSNNMPDDKRYSFTVLEGAEKLFEMPYDHYYSGEMVEIKVKKNADADIIVLVNQTACAAVTEYDDFNCYSFLMPNENVDLKIILSSDEN